MRDRRATMWVVPWIGAERLEGVRLGECLTSTCAAEPPLPRGTHHARTGGGQWPDLLYREATP